MFFWVGGIAGAGLSAYSSDSWGVAVGVRPWAGFLGGALMLFGARMASGCTRYVQPNGMIVVSHEYSFPYIVQGARVNSCTVGETALHV